MIKYRGAKIQLLDLPGIIEGAKDGGRYGRQVIPTARTCSLIVITLDALKPLTHKKLIEHELFGMGIRLNKEPPKITFKKKDRGGVAFTPNTNGDTTFLDEETVARVLKEYGIVNADVKLHEDATDEDLIDVIEGSRVYIPAVYAINKVDQITVEELNLLDKMKHYVPVSAHKEWNLDGLLETVWDYLDMVRVYTKPRAVAPDYDDPIILSRKHCTVEDFCNRLHKGIIKNFKTALVWGSRRSTGAARGEGARPRRRGRRADCQEGVRSTRRIFF